MSNWWRRFGKTIAGLFGSGRKKREESRRSVAGGPPFGMAKLLSGLEHADPDVRVGAAHELSGYGDDPEHSELVIEALIGALTDPDASVRSSAALSLGECGPAAEGAVAALIEALAEDDDDVRSSAGIALEDIGDACRAPLQEALSHPDARVRSEAAIILDLMSGGAHHPPSGAGR